MTSLDDGETVILEMAGGSGVVAIVVGGQHTDAVLRRAMREAAARSGQLIVIQLVDDPSAVRRSLAKAILARDVGWWGRAQTGVTASVEAMADAPVGGTIAHVRDAACIVTARDTADSQLGMTILRPALDRVTT